jgi:hypothetical protein
VDYIGFWIEGVSRLVVSGAELRWRGCESRAWGVEEATILVDGSACGWDGSVSMRFNMCRQALMKCMCCVLVWSHSLMACQLLCSFRLIREENRV